MVKLPLIFLQLLLVNDQSEHRLSATPTCPLLVHFIIRHHPLWIPSCAEGQENIICWCNSSMVDIELYWNGWNKSLFFYLLVLILWVELIYLRRLIIWVQLKSNYWFLDALYINCFLAEAFFPPLWFDYIQRKILFSVSLSLYVFVFGSWAPNLIHLDLVFFLRSHSVLISVTKIS